MVGSAGAVIFYASVQTKGHRAKTRFSFQLFIHPKFLKEGLEFLEGNEQTEEFFQDLTLPSYTSGNDNCVSKGTSMKESLE